MGCQLINPLPYYSDMQDNGIKHFKIIPNKSCSNNNKPKFFCLNSMKGVLIIEDDLFHQIDQFDGDSLCRYSRWGVGQ